MARWPMFRAATRIGKPLNRVRVPDTKRRLIALATAGCQPQDCGSRLRVGPIPADSDGNGAERMRGRSTCVRWHLQIIGPPEGIASFRYSRRACGHQCDSLRYDCANVNRCRSVSSDTSARRTRASAAATMAGRALLGLEYAMTSVPATGRNYSAVSRSVETSDGYRNFQPEHT